MSPRVLVVLVLLIILVLGVCRSGGGVDGGEIAAGWKKGAAGALKERTALSERSEGKIGRAVLTIALVVATALLAAAVAAIIGLAVQRHFRGPPMQHRETPHAAPPQRGPSESEQP